MLNSDLMERISIDRSVMVGKPVIKGTRLTVPFILNLLAHGSSYEDILTEYDGLTTDDIQACLAFASQAMDNLHIFPLQTKAAS